MIPEVIARLELIAIATISLVEQRHTARSLGSAAAEPVLRVAPTQVLVNRI